MIVVSYMNEVIKQLLIVIAIMAFVGLIVPIIKKLAFHIGAIDIPNERSVHTKPIPRLGGLAIYAGFLLGYMCFCKTNIIMNSILIGSFIIILTGIADDIKPLKALTKLIFQTIACLVIVFYGKILLTDISAFGFYIDFGILAYPITILFILICINCMNLIDGLDGLSSGISSIYFLTIGIICYFKGSYGLDYIFCSIMLGACLGFLIHNHHPAKIFAGDTGSMFLGFIIGIIALLGFKNVTFTSLLIPFLIIAIPVLDAIFAIIRRFLKGEKIMSPDKFHIHHQLLNLNFSHKATVNIICFIDALFALASIIYVLVDRTLGYILYGLLLILVLIFVLKTNVVVEHKKNNH